MTAPRCNAAGTRAGPESIRAASVVPSSKGGRDPASGFATKLAKALESRTPQVSEEPRIGALGPGRSGGSLPECDAEAPAMEDSELLHSIDSRSAADDRVDPLGPGGPAVTVSLALTGPSHTADVASSVGLGAETGVRGGAEAAKAVAAWAARSIVEAVIRRRSARVRLSSERLGDVSLDISVRGTEVSVAYRAAGSAAGLLSSEAPALTEELARGGLRLVAFLPADRDGAILRA